MLDLPESTLYNGNTGAKHGLVVTVPGPPTGIVFNGSSDFKVDAGTGLAAARFIFATDDGQIAGWNGVGTAAISAATTADAVYLGLAIGSSGGANYLYAANFSGARVDVFDTDYAIAHLAGDFTDPGLPDDYAPFGSITKSRYATRRQARHSARLASSQPETAASWILPGSLAHWA